MMEVPEDLMEFWPFVQNISHNITTPVYFQYVFISIWPFFIVDTYHIFGAGVADAVFRDTHPYWYNTNADAT